LHKFVLVGIKKLTLFGQPAKGRKKNRALQKNIMNRWPTAFTVSGTCTKKHRQNLQSGK